MDKFVKRFRAEQTRPLTDDSESASDFELTLQPPPRKAAALAGDPSSDDQWPHSSSSSSCSSKMRAYKDKLSYNPAWKEKHHWLECNASGMICTVCKLYGVVPVQARGAWVTRPVNNWVKAPSQLRMHERSEWHMAAVKKQAMSLSTECSGNVVQQILAASEEEKKLNQELIKKLVRSLYFSVKHHIPHTTIFKGLITLQIENGDIRLKAHRENCPHNATYESYATVVDLLACISKVLEENLLTSFKASRNFSLMADEATDISSKEDLSVCARWLENNKPVDHFLGIVHAKETTAKGITSHLCTFLK